MLDKAIKAVAEGAVREMNFQADGVKSGMNACLEQLERYKRLVGELVKLSAEVREGDFFAKVDVLKIGEVVVIGGGSRAEDMGLHVGNTGGFIRLHGYPTETELAPGRYRAVLTLQKVGDI